MNKSPCDFPYSPKHIEALETTLSPGRLHLYRKYATNDSEALQLYCWNTTLSQTFYWPLHMFEVTLRNALADSMFEQYGENWFNLLGNLKHGPDKEEMLHIDKAKYKLSREGLPYGHDNIVAAVSLSLWEGLLKVEYEKTLWEPLFSNLLPISRSEAFRKVNQIKRLRNNVAHHEPIFVFLHKGTKRLLFKDYKMILKLIHWINDDTAQWVEYHSSKDFFETWNGAPDFIEMPKLTVANNDNRGNTLFWQFSNLPT